MYINLLTYVDKSSKKRKSFFNPIFSFYLKNANFKFRNII